MIKKIAISGAGYSGKSTIVKKLHNDFPNDIVVIPEITEIYRNTDLPFPINKELKERYKHEYINSIINIQKELESLIVKLYTNSHKYLICDRGILDTIAYYSDFELENWFADFNTSLDKELNRYDLVIQLATNSVNYGENGHIRPYNIENALNHQKILHGYYSKHDNYHFIDEQDDILIKYNKVLNILF